MTHLERVPKKPTENMVAYRGPDPRRFTEVFGLRGQVLRTEHGVGNELLRSWRLEG